MRRGRQVPGEDCQDDKLEAQPAVGGAGGGAPGRTHARPAAELGRCDAGQQCGYAEALHSVTGQRLEADAGSLIESLKRPAPLRRVAQRA